MQLCTKWSQQRVVKAQICSSSHGLSSTSSSLFFNAMWSGQILVKSKGEKRKDHGKLPLWKGLFSSSGDSGVSEESDAVLSSEPTIL